MNITSDPDADAVYARFAPESAVIDRTEEAAPGVMLDLDENGNLVGIEVLSVRARAAGRYGAAIVTNAA